jgi:cell division protein FtsQ
VDLSDPEDVRAIFLGAVRQSLIHFGDSDYLARYQAYQAHLTEWLQQYPALRSVDMRYGKQVVLDTGFVANGSSGPLDDSTAAAAFAPAKDASNTAHSSETLASSASSAQATTKSAKHSAAPSHGSGTHHGSTTGTRESRHAPERGHPVRNPIMHVVSGM